ncbi:MAG TPA: glycine cleavage system protein GcvH [Candidatus Competibacteraceae bacterium]|nr:glycine cleavage system protein GcvH [Candidatus Competibacteraceae bacterium]
MSNIPADLKYTPSHEWVRDNGDGTVTVGITDFAQSQLGDVVYVEVPQVGRQVDAEEACAVVESVKSASDIYAPLAGEVVAANDALADAPETVNQDPYGEGWLFKLRVSGGLEGLLDAAAYETQAVAEH